MVIALRHCLHNNSANVWHLSSLRNKQRKHAALKFCFMRVSNLFSGSSEVLKYKTYTFEKGPNPQIWEGCLVLTFEQIFLAPSESPFRSAVGVFFRI